MDPRHRTTHSCICGQATGKCERMPCASWAGIMRSKPDTCFAFSQAEQLGGLLCRRHVCNHGTIRSDTPGERGRELVSGVRTPPRHSAPPQKTCSEIREQLRGRKTGRGPTRVFLPQSAASSTLISVQWAYTARFHVASRRKEGAPHRSEFAYRGDQAVGTHGSSPTTRERSSERTGRMRPPPQDLSVWTAAGTSPPHPGRPVSLSP